MKTTLDIQDSLLEQVRKIAARDGETLRSLVEQGLRKVAVERNAKTRPFESRDGGFGTPGAPSLHESQAWGAKRAPMYEGRGE